MIEGGSRHSLLRRARRTRRDEKRRSANVAPALATHAPGCESRRGPPATSCAGADTSPGRSTHRCSSTVIADRRSATRAVSERKPSWYWSSVARVIALATATTPPPRSSVYARLAKRRATTPRLPRLTRCVSSRRYTARRYSPIPASASASARTDAAGYAHAHPPRPQRPPETDLAQRLHTRQPSRSKHRQQRQAQRRDGRTPRLQRTARALRGREPSQNEVRTTRRATGQRSPTGTSTTNRRPSAERAADSRTTAQPARCSTTTVLTRGSANSRRTWAGHDSCPTRPRSPPAPPWHRPDQPTPTTAPPDDPDQPADHATTRAHTKPHHRPPLRSAWQRD